MSQVGVLYQFLERVDEDVLVAVIDQQSGDIWLEGFANTAHIVGYNGQATHLGLNEGVGKGFFCRGVNGDVAFLIEIGGIREQSQDLDAVMDS